MTLKVVRGVQRSPIKLVEYGVEGIGKSTLASQFPNALILDTEEGSGQLDCARVSCPDWKTLEGAMLSLGTDAQGFQTIVIDSADWAERHAAEVIKKKHNKASIEDIPYGKGHVQVAEQFSKLLTAADYLVSRGLHVVFVAHAKVVRVSPPEMTDGYDRWEMKLGKHTAPLLREWCDCLLFANYKQTVVEGSDGRMKARGGKERVLYTERTAAFDAKNRYGLSPEIPMSIDALSHLWAGAAAPSSQPSRSRWMDRVKAATTVEALGAIGDEADEALSSGDLSDSQHEKLRGLIEARHNELEPQEATA